MRSNAAQPARDGSGVVLARQYWPSIWMRLRHAGLLILQLGIVVRDDDDIGVAEQFIELVAPLSDAAGVGRRRVAEPHGAVRVPLALADQHAMPGLHRHDQLGELVEHLAGAFGFPNPSALAVRLALAESFVWIIAVEAHDLEQQHAIFVLIGIGRENRWPVVAAFPIGLWRRRRVGNETEFKRVLPRFEEQLAA
jgi:hypothetical protein